MSNYEDIKKPPATTTDAIKEELMEAISRAENFARDMNAIAIGGSFSHMAAIVAAIRAAAEKL